MTLKELKFDDRFVNEDRIVFRKVNETCFFVVLGGNGEVYNFYKHRNKILDWIEAEQIWFLD
jgi:hypothetical protein